MEEKVKEVKHIMIPVKEYRKLIAKIERLKIRLNEKNEGYENCRRWWKEEEAKRKELEQRISEKDEVIKQYKEEFEKRLGISELQKVKEMQDA